MAVYQFKQSMLTPWQKSTIEINDDVVKVDEFNNPLSSSAVNNREIPTKSIRSVSTTRTFKLKAVLIAVILVFLGIKGIINLFSGFVSFEILLLPFGVFILLCSISETLCISYDGKEYDIDISLFERETLSKIVNDINERLDTHLKV